MKVIFNTFLIISSITASLGMIANEYEEPEQSLSSKNKKQSPIKFKGASSEIYSENSSACVSLDGDIDSARIYFDARKIPKNKGLDSLIIKFSEEEQVRIDSKIEELKITFNDYLQMKEKSEEEIEEWKSKMSCIEKIFCCCFDPELKIKMRKAQEFEDILSKINEDLEKKRSLWRNINDYKKKINRLIKH